jgi:hypothetical protein
LNDRIPFHTCILRNWESQEVWVSEGQGREELVMSRRLRSRPISAFVFAALAASIPGGCAIPDYHMPQGFSSTYFRAIQHQNAVKSAVDSAILRSTSPTSAPPPVDAPADEPGPLYVPQNSESSPAVWDRFRSSLSPASFAAPSSATNQPPPSAAP